MIFEKVAEMVAEQFAVDVDTVTMDTMFEEDLNADSLDIVELTMAIEEEFEVGELEDEDLSAMHSVGDVVRFIQKKLNEI